MNETTVLRGLAQVGFWADDVDAATRWYIELLGVEPYFVVPAPPAPAAYVEFRLGDHQDELGITSSDHAPPGRASTPGGAVASWHVEDLHATHQKLLAMGATAHMPPVERGEGFITAAVVDPFGNVLGLIHSPHYHEMITTAGTGASPDPGAVSVPRPCGSTSS